MLIFSLLTPILLSLPQINASKYTFGPEKGIFLFPHLKKRKHLLFLPTSSSSILLRRIFFYFFKVGVRVSMLNQGNLLKMRHLVTLRSKPNLLWSHVKNCSLGLAVLNSITMPFLFIFFLNRRQSTTQDRQWGVGNKGKIILYRVSRHFS